MVRNLLFLWDPIGHSYFLSLSIVIIICIEINSYRRFTNVQKPNFKQTKSNEILTIKTKTLLIDNFDSYTYNIFQLLSEINNEEPYVIYNNAFSDWQTLVNNIPYFDNIGSY